MRQILFFPIVPSFINSSIIQPTKYVVLLGSLSQIQPIQTPSMPTNIRDIPNLYSINSVIYQNTQDNLSNLPKCSNVMVEHPKTLSLCTIPCMSRIIMETIPTKLFSTDTYAVLVGCFGFQLERALTTHMITSSILIDEPPTTRTSFRNPLDNPFTLFLCTRYPTIIRIAS